MHCYFNLIFVLISVPVLLTCKENQNQQDCPDKIYISIDSLEYPVEGSLSKVVIFHHDYYLMYETSDTKQIIVTNPAGGFIRKIELPEAIQERFNYELSVDGDSLYIKDENEETTFVFDETHDRFKLTKPKELKIFEDELYEIYAHCRGEWGSTLFFTNKKTHQSFEVAANCPVVINKPDSEYYVTNLNEVGFPCTIYRIRDPQHLEKSDLNFQSKTGSNFMKGIEITDTINMFVQTSFFIDNQHYILSTSINLLTNNDSTSIFKVENGKLAPYYTFDFTFYCYSIQSLDNGTQLLTFIVKGTDKRGFLIIDGQKFKFWFQS